MKRAIKIFLNCTLACSLLSSCTSKEEPIAEPQEVNISLDYTFVESGSMTKATGADAYDTFYKDYIETKKLTPTSYTLTFTNKSTGAQAIINGMWKNKDGIRLIEGEYEVTGTSYPVHNAEIPSDTVYIAFNEIVNISKDMEKLTLTADYDSYLLLFDSENYTKCRYFHNNNSNDQVKVDKNLYVAGDVLSIFIKDFSYTTSTFKPLIELTRPDKQVSKIYLDKMPFEKGKYYYFNDMTNSFDIPAMESGN